MNHRGAQRFAEQVAEQAQEMAAAPREAIEGAVRTARETVESNPGIAVFSAFGLGLAVGVMAAMCLTCSSTTSSRRGWYS